jgi:hypothetical protein
VLSEKLTLNDLRIEGTQSDEHDINGACQQAQSQSLLDNNEAIDEFLNKRNLSPDQKRLATHLKKYFQDMGPVGARKMPAPNPPFILLTGDPGSGKSYATDSVIALADLMKVGTTPSCSYNGIAAFNIDGVTLCKLLGINSIVGNHSKTSIGDDALQSIRAELGAPDMCIFIVDEISTLNAQAIAMIDVRLQQVMESTQEYGGIAMLFVGDFNQLGPVKKTFLLEDMMNWANYQRKQDDDHGRELSSSASRVPHNSTTATRVQPISTTATPPPAPTRTQHPNKPKKASHKRMLRRHKKKAAKRAKRSMNNSTYEDYSPSARFSVTGLIHRGCLLFSKIERYHLSTQLRSRHDLKHTQFLKDLSDGEPIQVDNIARYKSLTRKDVENQPEEWKFAPILVATNRERMNIIHRQSILFAKHTDSFVFKWKVRCKKWLNKPPTSEMDDIEQSHPFFWQYFVPGADAFLNNNINPSLGMVNGSSITCHSLSISNPLQVQAIQDAMSTLQKGSEIVLQSPPDAINVIIQPALDGKAPSKRRLKQLEILRKHAIVDVDCDTVGAIIIPILPSKRQGNDSKSEHSVKTKSIFSPLAKVTIQNIFSFDLAFAMTVHKAQGRTIPRVILALDSRPMHYSQMVFASVLVALSRVSHTDHMRILRHKSGPNQSYKQAFQYLTKLRPNKFVAQFYSGFENDNGKWNRHTAQLSFY